MGLGGLWHGANLTFLAWGALHGVGLMVTHQLSGRIGASLTGRLAALRDAAFWAGTFGFVTLPGCSSPRRTSPPPHRCWRVS